MNWQSPAEFFAMGGYALYVWSSFGACAVALALEPWLLSRRRRGIMRGLRLHALAEQMGQQSE